MTKTFRDNCDKDIVQQTSREPLFADVQTQLKMYFFIPFVRPCRLSITIMVEFQSHACKHLRPLACAVPWERTSKPDSHW